MGKKVSSRPSLYVEGGNFGIPSGAKFTITGLVATTWFDAGTGALVGDRQADDPAIKLSVEIENIDEPRDIFLGVGKAKNIVPAEDGEGFEQAEDSSQPALNKNSNGGMFLTSLTDKTKGKKALPETVLDRYSDVIGLVGIADNIEVKRNFRNQSEEEQKKSGPATVLVCKEILELPKKAAKVAAAAPKKVTKEEATEAAEEVEAEDKKEDADDDFDAQAEATAIIKKLLKSPKYSDDGIAVGKVYAAVAKAAVATDFTRKTQEEIAAVAEDEDWLTNAKRPWTEDDGVIKSK